MINLTQEEKDLFLQFQERWSLEKVKNMTLEKYTGFGNIGKERDDFVYWIEYKLKDMGRFSSRGVEKGKKSMGLFADKDKVHFNEKLGKIKRKYLR